MPGTPSTTPISSREWDTVARWDGREAVDLVYQLTGDEPVAVIVQGSRSGQVYSAASLP